MNIPFIDSETREQFDRRAYFIEGYVKSKIEPWQHDNETLVKGLVKHANDLYLKRENAALEKALGGGEAVLDEPTKVISYEAHQKQLEKARQEHLKNVAETNDFGKMKFTSIFST